MNNRLGHIEEATVIEDHGYELSGVRGWLAGHFDKITKGNKSRIVTEALIYAGVTKNPEKIRALSQTYKEPLDKYFDQLDYQKLSGEPALTEPIEKGIKQTLREQVPAVLSGVALGFGLGMYVFKKKKQS